MKKRFTVNVDTSICDCCGRLLTAVHLLHYLPETGWVAVCRKCSAAIIAAAAIYWTAQDEAYRHKEAAT